MKDFLKKSNIRNLYYTPYMLALNGILQCMIFIFCELWLKLRFPLKFERELFKLSDDGTIALDWVIDHEGGHPKKLSQRPILICISGLSGGNDNLYLYSLIREAQNQGYKCVVLNFRGTSGIPLTSSKLYWLNSWRDIKEPIDYIHQKYCGDDDYKQRNLYAYAVSLGGNMLTLYLCNEGEKSPLNGAISYGIPYYIKNNVTFFRKNAFKFFDFSMGIIYYMILK